jgi:N-acetyl-beta-hexosaminidase
MRVAIGDPEVTVKGINSNNTEAYSLRIDVSSQTVQLVGKSAAAVFYGVQSLLALADKHSKFFFFRSLNRGFVRSRERWQPCWMAATIKYFT